MQYPCKYHAYTLVEAQDVLCVEDPMPLLLHVLGHPWQALLATEEAVRDELLDDRLLAHEVDAII